MSFPTWMLNILITFTFTEGRFLTGSESTCVSITYHRRRPCGYRDILHSDCLLRGCCFQRIHPLGIPKCYYKVPAATMEKCYSSEYGRRPCGYRYISQNQCVMRGCCYKDTLKLGVPRCFKPVVSPTTQKPMELTTTNFETATTQMMNADPPEPRSRFGVDNNDETDAVDLEEGSVSSLLNTFLRMNGWQNATKSCEIQARSRNDCGYPGIQKSTCEDRGCCWNDSDSNTGVYWCFYPAWRSTVTEEQSQQSENAVRDEQNSPRETNARVTYEPPVTTELSNDTKKTRGEQSFDSTDTPSTSSLSTHPVSTSTARYSVLQQQPYTTMSEVVPPYDDSHFPPLKDVDTEQESTERGPSSTTPVPTTMSSPPTTTKTTTTKSTSKNSNWNSAQYMLRLFNYYSMHNKAKPSASQSGSTQACSATETNCCKSNPSSPCCEYASAVTRSSAPRRRIVGGGLAGHLRSSVAYLTTQMYASQFCGGTLITKDWVVTAAHCVLDYCSRKKPVREILVKLGKIDKSNFKQGDHEQVIPAKQVICHPNNCKYANKPRLNDIALVRLSRSVTRTIYVSPAALPAQGELPVVDRKCIVLGWGETRGHGPQSVLKEVQVPLHANEQCNRPDWRGCRVRACMMCAGELNMDACEGDSGGPLFCERSGGYYVLHGVYSWGRCGAETNKPAVYTRFSYYADWIRSNIYTRQST